MTAYALELSYGDRVVVCDLPLFYLTGDGYLTPHVNGVEVHANLAAGEVRVRLPDMRSGSVDGVPLAPGALTFWPAGAPLVLGRGEPITYRVLGGEASTRSLHALRTCPRCRAALGDAADSMGGGYREVAVPRRVCRACDAIVVAPDALAGAHVLDSYAVRSTEPLPHSACDACKSQLARLLLTWGAHTVTIERCPMCHVVVLDPGEASTIAELARAMRAAEQNAAAPPSPWDARPSSLQADLDALQRGRGPLTALLEMLASLFR